MAEQTTTRSAGLAGGSSPRLVLVVMCVGYFLVLLDVTIVNVALGPQGVADLRQCQRTAVGR